MNAEQMTGGSCNCGAVSFEISGELKDVYVCYCSICRRATGSNGIAVLVVDNDRFAWTCDRTTIGQWKKPGTHWEMWFCRVCGSPVPGVNDASRTFIPAGLILNGGQNLKVAHHFYVDSRSPWDEIGDAGEQHPRGFEE